MSAQNHPILPDPNKVRALALGLADPDPSTAPEFDKSIDLTRPAIGTLPDRSAVSALDREVSSYQWGRETYHDFLDRIQRIDASIEHPLAIEELRAYVLRMAIAYSGHPDAKIAVKALDMLARMKPVALYDEKRHRNPDEMNTAQIQDEINTLLKQLA